jgi:hypothetical protein
MSQKLAWSINAGLPGGSLAASGTLDCDAVTTASLSVDAGGVKTLDLQLDDVTKVVFLAINSSFFGGKVKVKASGTGATEITLAGPVFLYGAGVALLGPSLDTLKVTNTHTTDVADIEILIATTV